MSKPMNAGHRRVKSALDAATLLHERAVTVAEVIEVLPEADVQKLRRAYPKAELSITVSKALGALVRRGVASSPGKSGRTRFYASTHVLDSAEAAMPTAESRRQRVLRVTREAVEAYGRAILLGDIYAYAEAVGLAEEGIGNSVGSLVDTETSGS